MDNPYRIRSGHAADLPAVEEIERAVFTDPWSSGLLRDALDAESLIADQAGRVIAYLFLRRAGDEGEILNLAVAPSHHRQGVGRRLVEEAIGRLRANQVRRVFLEVRESNAGAHEFYHLMGFRPIGRRSRYYRNPPEPAVVMARDLEPSEGPA